MNSFITRRGFLEAGLAASVATVLFRVNPVFGQTDSKITSFTYRLLKEARNKGWEGEAAGLESTLVHIKDKKAQVHRIGEVINHETVLFQVQKPVSNQS